MNRNKRSITVNFKEPEGLAILHKLVRQSDVLVENFVSGKLAEMGLGWEDCRQLNPRLIYASITGMSMSILLSRKQARTRGYVDISHSKQWFLFLSKHVRGLAVCFDSYSSYYNPPECR